MMRGLSWRDRAARVRAGESDLADAEVDEPIDSYRRLFSALFEHSFDAVVLCTSEGEYLAVSDSFCTLTGYGREELLGQTSLSLKLVEPQTREATKRDVEAGRPGLYENVIARKDGTRCDVEFSQQFLGTDYTLVIIRDVTERRREELELLELASTDPLTGLLNRRGFFTNAEPYLAVARAPSHLVLADLDHLKTINDTYGHARGDKALLTFARTLSDVAAGLGRPTIVARLGGDEFVVMIALAVEGDVERLIEQVETRLARTGSDGHQLSATCGVAIRQDREDATAMLHRADLDLYERKRARTR